MDRTKFTDASTGTLVEIDRPLSETGKDWSFIPNELPPAWSINDPEIWSLLVTAMEQVGTLNGIGATLPDPELLLRPLQNSEAMASSQIEGTFVTPEQLLLFEMNPREARSTRSQVADWMEVLNYSNALKMGCQSLSTAPFSLTLIKSMHQTLMHGVRGRDKSPGEFRDQQVQIGSTARYIPPPKSEVQPLMQNLIDYIKMDEVDQGMHGLIRCFIVHYQFEAIHPFKDGNGRIGRVLLALMIYKLMKLSHPWLYLSLYFDRFQDEYFNKMFEVSSTGDWPSWIKYCLRGTIAQAKDSILRCRKFLELKAAYHAKAVSKANGRTHVLIDHLFKSPFVTVKSVMNLFGCHFQTAQSDIDILIHHGILRAGKDSRPKSYYAPEILQAAYFDTPA